MLKYSGVNLLDINKCIYCGSENLIRNVKIGLTAETGSVGPKYGSFIVGTEPMYADICGQCGSITRFHINEVDKKWITK